MPAMRETKNKEAPLSKEALLCFVRGGVNLYMKGGPYEGQNGYASIASSPVRRQIMSFAQGMLIFPVRAIIKTP